MVALSVADNPATGKPTESLAFINATGIDQFYDILIQNFLDASAPKTFDMFAFGGAKFAGNGSNLNYNTIGSSVSAQSDAGGGVVSVGAIDAADLGIDTIEPFSSHGPTNNGAIKPDVTAIDGVSVTGSGGFPSTFFGTSASAPHVAGLAALLLEMRPDLKSGEAGDDPAADRAALRAAILDTAVDLGVAGVDNTFGSGRVDGLAAANALLVAPVVVGAGQATDEGLATAFSLATFTDLDGGTHTATIDWGDGSAVEAGAVTEPASPGTVSGTHTYADNGPFIVTVTVTDDDGLVGSDTLTITVANVAPIVAAGPDQPAVQLAGASLALATFTDAGSGDTHTATIDWGDGSPVEAGIVTEPASPGTVSGSHAYTHLGPFTVTVTVTDDDGGSDSDTLTVTVGPPLVPIPGVTPWALVALAGSFVLLMAWTRRRRAQAA